MKTKSITFVIALFMLGLTGGAQIETDPISNFIAQETIKLELEEKLFGFPNNLPEPVSIVSIELFEVDEEIVIDFDTSRYVPENFDPFYGRNRLNWDEIPLYKVDEEVEINFNTTSTEALIEGGK